MQATADPPDPLVEGAPPWPPMPPVEVTTVPPCPLLGEAPPVAMGAFPAVPGEPPMGATPPPPVVAAWPPAPVSVDPADPPTLPTWKPPGDPPRLPDVAPVPTTWVPLPPPPQPIPNNTATRTVRLIRAWCPAKAPTGKAARLRSISG